MSAFARFFAVGLSAVLLFFGSVLSEDTAAAQTVVKAENQRIFAEVEPSVDLPADALAALDFAREDPATKEARLVELRPNDEIAELLRNAEAKRGEVVVEFALSKEEIAYLTSDGLEPTDEDGFEWFATLVDGEGKPLVGTAVIAMKASRIFGSVSLDGRQIEFHSVGKGLAVVREINEEGYPLEHRPDFMQNRLRGRERDSYGDTEGPGVPRSGTEAAKAMYTITVLAPYTRAAEIRIRAAGYANVWDFVRQSTASANLIYKNSNVNVRLSAVKAYRMNFTETGDWDADKLRFFNDTGVRQERADSDADIVVLFFDDREWCGEVQDIDARYHTAFAVLYWSCSIGNKSFAHEVGHIEGAEHDDANASSPPAYPYGYGYIRGTRWRTVMSYPAGCGCPRLGYFSNPDIMHPTDHVPMGNSTHNNARVLRETAPRISAFQ